MANFANLLQLFKDTFGPAPQTPQAPQAPPQLPSMIANVPSRVQEWGQQLTDLYPGPNTEQTMLQGLQDMLDPNKSELYRKFTELMSKFKR